MQCVRDGPVGIAYSRDVRNREWLPTQCLAGGVKSRTVCARAGIALLLGLGPAEGAAKRLAGRLDFAKNA